MADIDNIPLDVSGIPILESYDAGLLWSPEDGANNSDWHDAIRSLLGQAEDFYEGQYDQVVDALVKSQRQTVLLQAFVRMLTDDAFAGSLTTERLGQIISEYLKVDGAAPLIVTEGYKQWAKAQGGKPTNEIQEYINSLPRIGSVIASTDTGAVGRADNVIFQWSLVSADTIGIDPVVPGGILFFGLAPTDFSILNLEFQTQDGTHLAVLSHKIDGKAGDRVEMTNCIDPKPVSVVPLDEDKPTIN